MLNKLCDELHALGQDRNHFIGMQFRMERPSEQYFKRQLDVELGDHGLDSTQMYAKAQKLRTFVIRHADGWLGLLPDEDAVVDYLSSVNGKMTVAEKNVMRNMAIIVSVEHSYLQDIVAQRTAVEKEIERVAKKLPVAEWYASNAQMNYGGLGKIIAETGDLNNYANPDKLKKRMGLAPYAGKAYATHRKDKSLSKGEWVDAGYCPRRRSVIWQIGASIVKLQRGKTSHFHDIFMARKRREYDKAIEEGLTVVTTGKATVANWIELGLPEPVLVKEVPKSGVRSCGHINNRAHRYMEQQILIELWANWTGNVRDGQSSRETQSTVAVT